MESSIEDRVKVKLFMGYLITSEMRMHLNQSKEWKQVTVAPSNNSLSEVHYQNKDYIGRFTSQDSLSILHFKQIDHEMREILQSYCPNLKVDSLLTYTFPQVFVV